MTGMRKQGLENLTALLLAGMILFLTFGFFVSPKRDFSENENRYLADFPAIKLEKIISGETMESLNSYLSDHFLFRDFFVGIKTQAELFSGKKKINGIYPAEDGYLIEEYKEPENTERIIRTLRSFSEEVKRQDIRLGLMLVPTAAYVYEDKLPRYAPPTNQRETARQIYEESGIRGIDCSHALLAYNGEEPLYYRTDHHWTTRGAYEGYRVFCEDMGLEPVSLKDMDIRIVTEDFCGTLYSRFGDYSRKGDRIKIYSNPADDLRVRYPDTGETADSLYNLEYAGKKDKYSLFLNNLHPLVEITNQAAASDRELVLIKDSYANSMAPFLTAHYKKIYVFDTRYYKEGPSAFINGHPEITDVLILYNMNTLDTDSGIRGIY